MRNFILTLSRCTVRRCETRASARRTCSRQWRGTREVLSAQREADGDEQGGHGGDFGGLETILDDRRCSEAGLQDAHG